MLGDAALAQEMAARMLESGVYVDRLLLPGGAEGPGAHPHADVGARIAREDVDRAIAAFAEVGRDLGVIC